MTTSVMLGSLAEPNRCHSGLPVILCASAAVWTHALPPALPKLLESPALSLRGEEPVPTSIQYQRAFLAIEDKITPEQLSMLKAHHGAAGHAATMMELARAGGYDSYAVANLHY